jgi:hypothetical protein
MKNPLLFAYRLGLASTLCREKLQKFPWKGLVNVAISTIQGSGSKMMFVVPISWLAKVSWH